jgi:protein-tyrosine-phosphatase
MGAERKEQRLKPKVVLFVCTGNYYRSRFAELLFNSSARRERLGWQAISRGLELNVQNVGPISPHVCSGLRARGVELEYAGLRSPLPLALGDLLSADRVVALKRDEHPTAPRSPWQNGHVERLIGSIRRESLDHLIVFGKAHLRRILKAYSSYTTKSGPICHWIRMLQSSGGGRRSVASLLYRSSAGSIINTSGFRFWIGTGGEVGGPR